MLKIIEYRANSEPIEKEVNLDNLPATVGRSHACDFTLGKGLTVKDRRNPQGPHELFLLSISKVHATIYLALDKLFVKDGGDTPSQNGIFRHGRVLREPTRIYPGMPTIQFILESEKGYRVDLVWEIDLPSATEDTTPTLQLLETTDQKTVEVNPKDILNEVKYLEKQFEDETRRLQSENEEAIAACDLNISKLRDFLKQATQSKEDDVDQLRAELEALKRNRRNSDRRQKRNFRFVRWMLFASTISTFFVIFIFLNEDKSQAIHDVGKYILIVVNGLTTFLTVFEKSSIGRVVHNVLDYLQSQEEDQEADPGSEHPDIIRDE